MNDSRVISARFPYLPIRLEIHDRVVEVEALLDTGFDGAIVVPAHLIPNAAPVDLQMTWTLADGSDIIAPTYRGTAQIGSLPPVRVLVSVLGNEPIIGRALSDRFGVYLDHGNRIVVER